MTKKTLTLSVVAVLCVGGAVAYFLSGGNRGVNLAEGQEAPQIILYTGENFTGRSVTIQGDLFDLPLEDAPDDSKFDWNDKVRSLVVTSGTWRIYQHGRCNTRLDKRELAVFDFTTTTPVSGWSSLVSAQPGQVLEIPNLAAGGLGEDISSVELISHQSLPVWSQSFRSE